MNIKNIFQLSGTSALCLAAASFMLTSCLEDNDETIALKEIPTSTSGIPSDDEAGDAPSISNPNTTIPNPSTSEEEYEGEYVCRFDMTGVWDPINTTWMRLKGTGESDQNTWLTIDNKNKGFIIYNTADDTSGDIVTKADLVFLVDNSGSMGDEANTIARDIQSWSKELAASGLDISFGCVGYGETGYVDGAINLTTADKLSTFLNYSTGVARTKHFDNTTLSNAAKNMTYVPNECGGMALTFANSNMNFRNGSNRIYVNFTDEPNQPYGVTRYSTEFFKSSTNWSSSQGTVHTVFSDRDTIFTETIGYNEKPWRLSWYTGGTFLVTNSSFSGVSLSSLPVSGAMQNSYIIRFRASEDLKDGKSHYVRIVVRSTDGKVRASKTFYATFQ